MPIKNQTHDYTRKNNFFDAIHESLVPCISGPAPEEKWMCFPEMDQLITSAYEKVCIDLTKYSFSKTFFYYALPHFKI